MKTFLTFILICFFVVPASSQLWECMSPTQCNMFSKIHVADTLHLTGIHKTMCYYSNDGGQSWNQVDLHRSLIDIYFENNQKGWIVSSESKIFRTTDGLNSWDTITIPVTPSIINFKFCNDTTFQFIATYPINDSDTLYKTTDGGISWTTLGLNISDAFFTDEWRGWKFKSPDSLFKSHDGGHTWTVQILPSVVNHYTSYIFFLDSLHGWITGSQLMRTTDGGQTWMVISGHFDSVLFTDSVNGIASNLLTLYVTNDGGLTWTSIPGTDELIMSQFFYVQGKYFGFGFKFGSSYNLTDWEVFHYNTFPNSNSFIPSSPGYFFYNPPQLHFSSEKNGAWLSGDAIVGHGGTRLNELYTTTDNGRTWKFNDNAGQLTSSLQLLNDSLWFISTKSNWSGPVDLYKSYDQFETLILIKPNGGSVHFHDSLFGLADIEYTLDGGMNWQPMTINGSASYLSLFNFYDPLNGWAAGNGLYRTYDGGITWDSVAAMPDVYIRRMQFIDDRNGIVEKMEPNSNIYGKFYRTADGGQSWSQMSFPVDICDFHMLDSLRGWFAGDSILYTDDGGVTFHVQSDMMTTSITFIDSIIGFAAAHRSWGYNGFFLRTDQTGTLNSISTIEYENGTISIYPNPAYNSITISSPDIIQQIDVYDVVGRLVISQSVEIANLFQLNVEELRDGIYLLKVKNKNQNQSLIFIKQGQ